MTRRERLTTEAISALCESGAGETVALTDRQLATAMKDAGIIGPVTIAQALAWAESGRPAWLPPASPNRSEPVVRRSSADKLRARRTVANRDRLLCPLATAQFLQLKVREVAMAMRCAGITDKLTIAQARQYVEHGALMPDWLAELVLARDRRATDKAERRAATQVAYQAKLEALYPVVLKKILGGHRVKGADQELVAADIVFRAWKDMHGWSGAPDDMKEEQAVLQWAGWAPQDVSHP